MFSLDISVPFQPCAKKILSAACATEIVMIEIKREAKPVMTDIGIYKPTPRTERKARNKGMCIRNSILDRDGLLRKPRKEDSSINGVETSDWQLVLRESKEHIPVYPTTPHPAGLNIEGNNEKSISTLWKVMHFVTGD